ncbi:MAG: hypothetical protein OEU36_12235 [Gammaproteobacteria bacterium]|nr:hypothetical protein [Gammaproteobacteria bacterium]
MRSLKSDVPQRHNIIGVLLSLPLLVCFTGRLNAQQDWTAAGGTEQSQAEAKHTHEASETGTGDVDRDANPSEAEQRRLGANENPMAASDARREAQRVEEKKGEPKRTTGFDVYGSIRLRYREQGGETDWQDGGSRIGTELEWQSRQGSFLVGRYEAGFNLLTGLEDLTAPGEETGKFQNTVFTRLGYVGLDVPNVNVIAGKNWSPYYDVAGFTDRFQGTGASASGTYNAQTDGGPTGPRR